MAEQVIFLRMFPFKEGQQLHIQDGPRHGDWEVIAVDDRKMTLRCPVSGFVVTWDRFCYFVEERESPWPAKE